MSASRSFITGLSTFFTLDPSTVGGSQEVTEGKIFTCNTGFINMDVSRKPALLMSRFLGEKIQVSKP